VIVVVAALKGGVGKTTTAVYLAAAAMNNRRVVHLLDSDPQASAADWLDGSEDPFLEDIELVEAPTERLLARALEKIEDPDVAIVDTPPGDERLLLRALSLADVVVIPTRVGGMEMARVEAVLQLVPRKVPYGLVISSARTFTKGYAEVVAEWTEADVRVWGSIPERVSIASGPDSGLSPEGVELYRGVWRRAQRAARGL
jgi:chromosome partitioning protein